MRKRVWEHEKKKKNVRVLSRGGGSLEGRDDSAIDKCIIVLYESRGIVYKARDDVTARAKLVKCRLCKCC